MPETTNCDECGAEFATPNGLRSHARVHSPKEIGPCACGRMFRSVAGRVAHERQYHQWSPASWRTVRGAPHGTSGGYTNQRCRCARCRNAWATYCAGRRARLRDGGVPDTYTHGLSSTYVVAGCRCAECLTAHNRATLEDRHTARRDGQLSSIRAGITSRRNGRLRRARLREERLAVAA